MKRLCFSLILFSVGLLSFLIVVGQAVADEALKVAPPPIQQPCHMEETASIGVNITDNAPDIKTISSIIDKKIEEIKAAGMEAKTSQFELQNYNYNISSTSNGGIFVYSASFNYEIKPARAAPDIMALLISKGYVINLNISANKQCP